MDLSLAKLVRSLLDAAAAGAEGSIDAALARLVEGLGVERISVLGYAEETARLIVLYHASTPGISALPETIDTALLPHAVAALQHGSGFRHEHPSEIPEQDREGFARLGARSVLGLPISLGQAGLGCMLFETLTTERSFGRELEWFSAAAQIAQGTLARQRARAAELGAKAREDFELGELLAAFLGHDLRNPLSAISGLTQLILRREALPDDVVRRVTAIEAAVTRTNQWIGTLLDFLESRGPAGLQLVRTGLDLHELTSRVIREQLGVKPDRPILLRGASPVTGSWDPARMAQLLGHLLANAQSGNDGSGPVNVGLDATSNGVVLSVRTSSAPILPEAMQKLFNPFGRPEPPEASRPRSLRLGLHMARQIAESHGGSLVVASSPEGETVFTVRLPTSAA